MSEETKVQQVEAAEPERKTLPAPPERSKFFGQPTNWYRGAGWLSNLSKLNNQLEQQEFHKVALSEVRKALGKKCKHLTHYKKANGETTFKAKLELDGKLVTFNVQAESTNVDDFQATTYKGVFDILAKHLSGNVQGSPKIV